MPFLKGVQIDCGACVADLDRLGFVPSWMVDAGGDEWHRAVRFDRESNEYRSDFHHRDHPHHAFYRATAYGPTPALALLATLIEARRLVAICPLPPRSRAAELT